MTDHVKITFNEDGQWLLPRRFKKGDDPAKDRLYDAAERLVLEGHARWIRPSSTMYPGIEETRRQ